MKQQTQTAMRTAFGEALLEMGEKKKELVVLDADVSSSTQTVHFGAKYPERFFNVGVAEANMVDIAGGMATCGLKPVASTFAIFLALKCTDQIRNNICYNNLPVTLVGGYAGLSDSFDGASHQSITDIAIMRAMPNMKVLVPGDSTEMKQALAIAMEEDGPVYIRASRNPSPDLFKNADPMEIGKIRKIREGNDLTIAVCGVPTFMAIEAADELASQDIQVELLNVSSIKPMDEKTLVESVKKTGKVLTVEEHSVLGGMGSAIAEVLCKEYPAPVEMIGIEDQFSETGPYLELLEKYGLSVDNIIEKSNKMMNK
jgi:transketolase